MFNLTIAKDVSMVSIIVINDKIKEVTKRSGGESQDCWG